MTCLTEMNDVFKTQVSSHAEQNVKGELVQGGIHRPRAKCIVKSVQEKMVIRIELFYITGET